MRARYAGGVHPDPRKAATERLPIVELSPPALAVIPLQQHIGPKSRAHVKAGDLVLRGQKIGEDEGFVAALVVNGAECEPYLTADHRLMVERAADIVGRARILAHLRGQSHPGRRRGEQAGRRRVSAAGGRVGRRGREPLHQVPAVAILNIDYQLSFIKSIVYTLGVSVGYTLAIVLFATVRDRVFLAPVSRAFQGYPIAFFTASLMSLAFMGFARLFGL